MSAAALDDAKRRVDAIIGGYQRAAALPELSVLGARTAGKVYEGWVLCVVLAHLRNDEGFDVKMVGDTKVHLRSSPGLINGAYPHFEVRRDDERYKVWTDVEFLTLSHDARGAPPLSNGDYHELDILVVEYDAANRPGHDQVVIGIECKNTPYTKDLLRAILGVRRELSLLRPRPGVRTPFTSWPRRQVPAYPPSCLLTYCTSAAILNYDAPGETFGIDFVHERLP